MVFIASYHSGDFLQNSPPDMIIYIQLICKSKLVQQQSHNKVVGVDGGQTKYSSLTPETLVQFQSLICG